MVLKSIIFTVFLALLAVSDFHALLLTMFFPVLLYFFVKPLKSPYYPMAYVLLVALSLWTMRTLSHISLILFFALLFGFVFYLLRLARKNQEQNHRYYLFLAGLLSMVFAGNIFFVDPGRYGVGREVFFGTVLFLLMLELFLLWRRVNKGMSYRRRDVFLLSAIATLLFVEIFWALSLLPIGFLNLAALFGLSFFFILDLFWHVLSNTFGRVIILRNGSIFIVVFAVVMALSRWVI